MEYCPSEKVVVAPLTVSLYEVGDKAGRQGVGHDHAGGRFVAGVGKGKGIGKGTADRDRGPVCLLVDRQLRIGLRNDGGCGAGSGRDERARHAATVGRNGCGVGDGVDGGLKRAADHGHIDEQQRLPALQRARHRCDKGVAAHDGGDAGQGAVEVDSHGVVEIDKGACAAQVVGDGDVVKRALPVVDHRDDVGHALARTKRGGQRRFDGGDAVLVEQRGGNHIGGGRASGLFAVIVIGNKCLVVERCRHEKAPFKILHGHKGCAKPLVPVYCRKWFCVRRGVDRGKSCVI